MNADTRFLVLHKINTLSIVIALAWVVISILLTPPFEEREGVIALIMLAAIWVMYAAELLSGRESSPIRRICTSVLGFAIGWIASSIWLTPPIKNEEGVVVLLLLLTIVALRKFE